MAWFSPSRKSLGMAKAPLGNLRLTDIAYDGRFAYLTTPRFLYAVNQSGKLIWRFPFKDPNVDCKVFPTREGIAIFDGKQTITWHRLPKGEMRQSSKINAG